MSDNIASQPPLVSSFESSLRHKGKDRDGGSGTIDQIRHTWIQASNRLRSNFVHYLHYVRYWQFDHNVTRSSKDDRAVSVSLDIRRIASIYIKAGLEG